MSNKSILIVNNNINKFKESFRTSDLKYANDLGNTYLHIAMCLDRVEIASYLIKKLKNSNEIYKLLNKAGATPLDSISENSSLKMQDLINEHQFVLNHKVNRSNKGN